MKKVRRQLADIQDSMNVMYAFHIVTMGLILVACMVLYK